MKHTTGLLVAIAFGVVATISLQSLGQAVTHGCGDGDLVKLNKRFDDLEQILTAMQTQAAKAASDGALANANSQRQLANIGSQVADLNMKVVALTGRVNTLPPASR
jgi:outer membrane murein-binding lipoprotein Lpp